MQFSTNLWSFSGYTLQCTVSWNAHYLQLIVYSQGIQYHKYSYRGRVPVKNEDGQMASSSICL